MSAFCLEQTAGTEWVRFSSLSLGIFLGGFGTAAQASSLGGKCRLRYMSLRHNGGVIVTER